MLDPATVIKFAVGTGLTIFFIVLLVIGWMYIRR